MAHPLLNLMRFFIYISVNSVYTFVVRQRLTEHLIRIRFHFYCTLNYLKVIYAIRRCCFGIDRRTYWLTPSKFGVHCWQLGWAKTSSNITSVCYFVMFFNLLDKDKEALLLSIICPVLYSENNVDTIIFFCDVTAPNTLTMPVRHICQNYIEV